MVDPGRYDYYIIGAGPAGAATAWVLGKAGYKVLVLEALPRPGAKPCGRGIPDTGDLPVPLPRECILQDVRRARLLVDGIEAFDIERLRGVIVDRTCMVEALVLEYGGGIVTRAPVNLKSLRAILPGGAMRLPRERTIVATGHAHYRGEKIEAVQDIYEGEAGDTLEIFFDTELVGYYWIFPAGPGRVEVGVGGYAPVSRLTRLLDLFAEKAKRQGLRLSRRLKREGARIAVGGVDVEAVKGTPPSIGEAAGFVLPLTGEGIRPSMISGAVTGNAIARGQRPDEPLLEHEIASSIRLQRRVLEAVKRMPRDRRRELLLSVPESLHVKMALGKAGRGDLIKALARKPKLLVYIRSFL